MVISGKGIQMIKTCIQQEAANEDVIYYKLVIDYIENFINFSQMQYHEDYENIRIYKSTNRIWQQRLEFV